MVTFLVVWVGGSVIASPVIGRFLSTRHVDHDPDVV